MSGISTLLTHLQALEKLLERLRADPKISTGARERVTVRVQECKDDIRKEQGRENNTGE